MFFVNYFISKQTHQRARTLQASPHLQLLAREKKAVVQTTSFKKRINLLSRIRKVDLYLHQEGVLLIGHQQSLGLTFYQFLWVTKGKKHFPVPNALAIRPEKVSTYLQDSGPYGLKEELVVALLISEYRI
ncbi:hypothetical protein GCM10023331_28700 [Algivirga pacifica]|uniref:Uncharacterized protein n=2 Tax=Algivirga pacifica TaxID=1162670 RepID=A0ABP9DE03_9BACT